MAKFKFKYGTMNSGKSQELLRTAYNYRSNNREVLILTSMIDDRYGVGKVASRDGKISDAYAVSTKEDLINLFTNVNIKDFSCILIDEVQFFTEDMVYFIKEYCVLENEVPVIAYGLKVDFQNRLFPGSYACFVVAEELHEIETVCKFSNKKAIMNLRVDSQGKAITQGEQVEVGGNDKYYPVSHQYYVEATKKTK